MNNLLETYKFLNEGGTFSKNKNGDISVSFNSSSTDADNTGKGTLDSRMFGTKGDILWGDGTKGNSKTEYPEHIKKLVTFYTKILKYFSRKTLVKLKRDVYEKSFKGSVPDNILEMVWKWIETNNPKLIIKNCQERLDSIKKLFADVYKIDSGLNKGVADRLKAMNVALGAMKMIMKHYSGYQPEPLTTDKVYAKFPNLNKKTQEKIEKMLTSDEKPKEIAAEAKNYIEKYQKQYELLNNKYKRTLNAKGDKSSRYNVFNIPETKIKCISLFYMDDFNFSDAIKHGEIRQNPLTDKLLGISDKERETDIHGNLKKLNVVYDDKVDVDDDNIDKNFSLHDVKKGHNKQNYGLNDKNYTSVNKFIDKSIMYAAYALKQEKVEPSKIVAAFSSSKFNDLYSKNLSQKIGVEYVPDFFKRNLINAKFDEGDIRQKMEESKKFKEEEIETLLNKIRNQAYTEIAAQIKAPLDKFFKQYKEIFSGISVEKNSREKLDLEVVYDCLLYQAYNTFIKLLTSKTEENSPEQNIGKYLCQLFLAKKNFYTARPYDENRVFKEASFLITTKVGKKVFSKVLRQMYDTMLKYTSQLEKSGYSLNLTSKSFKITNLSERFRPYLNNVYVVADEYLTNGKFQKQFQNADFLLVDEDVNSGATMKLCIDAIKEKLPTIEEKRITCLANAYSDNSF